MALNVRIQHKYDSYQDWQDSSIILGLGEFAVVEIPTDTTGSGLTPPAIGLKVGDGVKTFKELPWIQATAGDVFAWAKKDTLDYNDLSEDFINEVKDLVNGEVQDSNTTYQFNFDAETEKLVIKKKELTETEFSDYASIDLPFSTKVDKDTDAVAGNLAQFVEGGNIVDSGEKIGDFLKKTEAEGIYATKTELGELEEVVSDIDTRVGTAETKLATLIGTDAEKSVRTIANEELAAKLITADAQEALDTLEEIAAWIQEHPGDAATMNQKITALETVVGKAAEGETEATGLVKAVADNAAAIADLEDVAHEHENQEVLDGIEAAEVEAWNAAVQTVSGVATEKVGTDIKVTAVPANILSQEEGEVLVLNCGTATTVI